MRPYNEGAYYCVESIYGLSCTTAEANEPLVAYVQGDGEEFAVVVDPSKRAEAVGRSGDSPAERVGMQDRGLVAVIPITNVVALDVFDARGDVFASIDLAVRSEMHRLSEDSVNLEPHH